MTNIGERSKTVEFKEGKKGFDKGIRALSAMINSYRTATIFFGVNEFGDVVGLSSCDTAAEKIRESIAVHVLPALEPSIEVLTTDDKLQYISVSATGGHPIYSYDGIYYVRDGSTNVAASPEELVRIVVSCMDIPQAERPSASQTYDGLNPNLTKVLNCLKKNRTAKLTEVSKKTGLSLSAVKKDVSELKRRGYVDNEGTNRNSVWVIR